MDVGKENYSDVIISAIAPPNHRRLDGLLNRFFQPTCRSKKTSKLRVTGRSPVNSPHEGPVTRIVFPFDDIIMSVLDRNP